MTPLERRASIGLAGIYGLRMLGLFIILPIFALYAEKLPGGQSHFLIGIALGAYGLTQSILQIPAGWLSDRYGRKPIIVIGLLLFAAGSFIAASADDIYWIIAGRVMQGAGAINAAVMALTADLTREEHRTKAMAMIGMTIGVTFSVSMVLSPLLYKHIGMSGMFSLIGILAFVSIAVVLWFIPNPAITRFHSDTETNTGKLAEVLRNKDLLRMDFGVFTLHAILMSVFMQVPFILRADGLDAQHQWQVYLPVMLIAFALMVPPIIIAEKKAKMKQVFMAAIALAAVAQLAILFLHGSIWGVAISLLLFFTAFNVLEATQPSIVSKIAPLAAKGTAMGVFSSVQFLGAFFGSAMGGLLMQFYGGNSVLVFAVGMLLLWLAVASGMRPPRPLMTRMYHLPELSEEAARAMQQSLAQLRGVSEVLVVAGEQIACLKVEIGGFDEDAVENLVKGA
ncbi:inner membrane transport protein YajR [Sideroxyarcus emersonii]|uniref:Inner membrane transport protein YajR n=2 Tax=Sideroxyarcus emersonii TaxID=2764705 RepID=A0AAN1X8Y9_9PROT|nr:inner membrane transport protein YajR [Sideroxyarcus emersonii]